jgi:mannose-6-phosphate isomerase-like protein (cupin superfamily)
MDMPTQPSGDRLIVQPGTEASYWQPVPANGYVTVLLAPHMVNMETPFSMGTQTVAPNSFVRQHAHENNAEVIYVLSGQGTAVMDGGEEEPMVPGKLFYFGFNREHKFVNTGETDMTFLWVMAPAGLETFFKAIGKERKAGDPAPPNFPRPDNILQIEAETVFNPNLTPDARS